jgi:hypothetical protein
LGRIKPNFAGVKYGKRTDMENTMNTASQVMAKAHMALGIGQVSCKS